MNEELDRQLCEKYPKIFRDRNAPMSETSMCWGFSHGDGWYNIINMLCANIQSHIDWSYKNHEWDLKWNAENPDKARPVRKIIPQVVATQVKEKFGTLRFYYEGGNDVIDGMVRMAESMTAVTCEECGSPGEQRHGGWIRTLCGTHESEYQARLKERNNG